MRRTAPLKKTGLDFLEEEEKTKKMEKEGGMKEKIKDKVKLHYLKIPLLKQ
jgi:hypothetical protein